MPYGDAGAVQGGAKIIRIRVHHFEARAGTARGFTQS
jgi:hypothetical protein